MAAWMATMASALPWRSSAMTPMSVALFRRLRATVMYLVALARSSSFRLPRLTTQNLFQRTAMNAPGLAENVPEQRRPLPDLTLGLGQGDDDRGRADSVVFL